MLLLCLLVSACKQVTPTVGPSLAYSPTLPPEAPAEPRPFPIATVQNPPEPFQPALAASQTKNDFDLKALPQPSSHPPHLMVNEARQSSPATIPVQYTPKRSGLIVALEHYLDHRNEEAVGALKKYSPEDQEFALVVLPILARMDQGETWSTSSGAQKLATMESMRSLQRRWKKSAPLTLQNVMFIEQGPMSGKVSHSTIFGEVKPRQSTTFRSEDWVHLYFEPMNLVDRPGEDGRYNVRISTAVTLSGEDGKAVYHDINQSNKPGSIGPRQDYCFTARFTLPAADVIPPGKYILRLAVHDLDTGRLANHTLPLQVVERNARSNKR